MSGGGGGTTSTQVKLPSWAEPTAKEMLARGQQLADAPYQQYGGQKIAGLNDAQFQALGATQQRATQGNALENASQGYLQGMVQGDGNPYGGMSNPYFEQQLKGTLDDVQSRVNSQFANPNAWGSSGHNEVLAKQLGSTASQMRMGQYDRAADLYAQDQGMKMQAAGMAPTFAQGDYNDLRALMGAGDAYRSYEQDLLNQGYQDWQEAQSHPYKQLDTLGAALQGATRGQSNTSQYAPGGSRAAGVLGGGMAGYGLASMFDANPMYGAAGGALLGALG